MSRCWAILLLLFSTCLCHPALGGGISCLWGEFFHIGRNLSGTCLINQPAPLGCQGQSLRLAADGQVLLPYNYTLDTGYFTVPATAGTRLHLRCTLACPGLEPIGECDITIRGGYPPSSPSQPWCYIPSGAHDLHCGWDPGGDALLPVTYTLVWKPAVASSSFPRGITVAMVNATMNAIIPRREIQVHNSMSVWVIASNALGSVRSHVNTFNTGDVVQPPAPVITDDIARPEDLEILWHVECPSAVLTGTQDISCQAQYRRQDQNIWTEGEYVAQDRFLLEGIEAFSAYVFRVRCACPGSYQVKSDWSDTYTARTTEAAPVGVLDVWSDSREMDQAVVWKELPVSKARGIVLGYVVTVDRVGANRKKLNVSAVGLGARQGGGADIGLCCRLPLPLLGVTGVSVSAYNSQGSTSPAPLAFPTTGNPVPGVLSVSTMGKFGFNISWDPPSPLAEMVQEYVVQQEEAGLQFAKGFDWTRTNKTQRSIILTGDFRDYTPYNLSLFGLFSGHSTLLGSVIAYVQQGAPPIVPGFRVSRISSSDVMLTWQHIPLTQRRGVIQCYRLGHGDRTEYTVSRDSTSVQVLGLQPGQMYQFWIVAKSEAKEGQKSTVKFSTATHTGYNIFMLLALVPLFTLGPFVIRLLRRHRVAVHSVFPAWCCEKVPDLANSKLLLQMQTPVWTGPCPAVESDPNLCVLEEVEAPPQKGGLAGGEEEEEEEEEQTDVQEEWEEESGSGRKGSAGRSAEESDGYTAEEEMQFFSDYEKHFMPCPWEVSCTATHL